ncbi:galactokinase [Nocardioides solisilvae]|uniref:galactokinase n=1 Tax=Nocardioides solisilvae TaxID=1542435 RepID=UPI000D749E51|nr:galactokinase family protein [Nocardioides solisilvae]
MLETVVDLDAAVREGFLRLAGREPAVVARAPGRVNLVGEHVDYLGGSCLPIALPLATWVALAPRDDGVVRVASTAEPLPWTGPAGEQAVGWARYVTSALAAVGHRGGADLLVDSTVPLGSGLSSSAALVCAVARATSTATAEALVEPCLRAERERVGAPTGGMDQTVCLLARRGHALLLDFGDGTRRHVPWHPEADGLELLVVDTRTRHAHAEGGYGSRRAEGERAVAAGPSVADPLLRRRLRHVVTEDERVRRVVAAAGARDWPAVGAAFTASHTSLRDDYEVSCPELDVTVEAALAAGALGARMTGGGFGGCAIALAPRTRRETLLGAVGTAYAHRGWGAPRAWVVEASGPATLLTTP